MTDPIPYALTEHAKRMVGQTTPPDLFAPMSIVLHDIRRERTIQDARFGQQDHPDGTSTSDAWQAAAWRYAADNAAKAGTLTWRDILKEETYEAFAEEDPALLRAELVQVAAVACAWIQAIDRRTA
jgi:hypothetical protein